VKAPNMKIHMGAHFRCTVDGKPIKLPEDSVKFTEYRHTHRTQTWGKGRRDSQENISFRQYHLAVPFTWGDKNNSDIKIDKHPGKWACKLKHEGKIVREFGWVIGADGKLQPHAEEGHALSFGPTAHLISNSFPGTTPYETRFAPKEALKLGVFYGHAIKSKELKAELKALPKLGATKLKKKGKKR